MSPNTDLSVRASELLEEIIKLMGYGFGVESKSSEGDRILLDIVGDDDGELIGPRGEILEALQFLLGRMLAREERTRQPVVLDNGGYRAKRDEGLADLALKLKDEAIKEGMIVALDPMSSHDRRVIHVALEADAEVKTESEGEGEQRRVLIVPAD